MYDEFVLEVTEPSLFVSSSLRSLDIESSFGSASGRNTISKFVPPPTVNVQEANMIKNSGKQGGTLVKSMKAQNFFLMLIMKGSMQQLWGMIRAVQMIIFYCLVAVPIPAHAFTFYEACMFFAKQDMFDG